MSEQAKELYSGDQEHNFLHKYKLDTGYYIVENYLIECFEQPGICVMYWNAIPRLNAVHTSF